MKTYRVYKLTFPDGKLYIGMTSQTLRERKNNGYNHNDSLKYAIRECGWDNVEKEILRDGLTYNQACDLEKKFIKELGATNPDVGYNVSLGGKETFAGLKHSEQHKAYMSELYKGKEFSEEHIEHLKKAHAKERIAVQSVDAEGNVTKKYDSIGDAAEDISGYKTNISRACRSGRPYKGRMWQFAEQGVS